MLALIGVLMLPAAMSNGAEGTSLYQQRALYKATLDRLTAGKTRTYRRGRAALGDYVLVPYLDYYELQSRLSGASAAEVQAFRDTHEDLPVADIIFSRWLRRQGARHAWRTFLNNYQPSENSELRCYYLRALAATGEREVAFAQVADLWLVASSQPKACDPLFEAWISAGNLTESMVWQRLGLAIDANSKTLARYLQRFFSSPDRHWAQSYLNVHLNPSSITRTSRFRADTTKSRTVIGHGLERLALSDPEAAAEAWQSYQESHDFDAAAREEIEAALAVGQAQHGQFPTEPENVPDSAAQGIAQAAIAAENWAPAAYWVDRLGGDLRGERRWQYWLARSLAGSVLNSERARLTYEALALERDYYGFLAAEQIGRPARLNHQPLRQNYIKINQLQRIPAVQRATELYAVGDLINARREWRELLPHLTTNEKATAAALAISIGWTSQSIHTASDAALRDTLELRFPLAYEDDFQRISHTTTVARSFLLAIARQESAFDPQARSSANARGLMQMTHPTAGSVARRIGLKAPSAVELYDPGLNIELAGHHLAALLDRYNGQRPLTAAAYNAGESRVERWTRDRSGLAMDVWIETIPFRETRNYVKNVLAFAQVYSQLLNSPVPMLQVHEAALQ